MIVNLTTEKREYILRAERPGYWAKRLADAEAKLAELRDAEEKLADSKDDSVKVNAEKIKAAEEDLRLVIEGKKEAEEKLAKHGPTVWLVSSIDKETLAKNNSNANMTLGKIEEGSITQSSGQVLFTNLMAVSACKEGLKGWRNLRDPKGNEIGFRFTSIGLLPMDVLMELASTILGTVDEDDAGNSETPLSS